MPEIRLVVQLPSSLQAKAATDGLSRHVVGLTSIRYVPGYNSDGTMVVTALPHAKNDVLTYLWNNHCQHFTLFS